MSLLTRLCLVLALTLSLPMQVTAQAFTRDEIAILKELAGALEQFRLRLKRPPTDRVIDIDCTGQTPCVVNVAADAGVQQRVVGGLTPGAYVMVSSDKNCSVAAAVTAGYPTWHYVDAQGALNLYTSPVVGACTVRIGGNVVSVGASAAALTSAIANAAPGDILDLADFTYVGSFFLTAETGWVTLRCSNLNTRLESNDNPGAIQTNVNASYWYILGCGLKHGSGVRGGDMMRLGTHTQTNAQIPEYFVLDGVRLIGDPTFGGKGGLKLHTAYTKVVSMTCTDLRWDTDSNCIGGWNGPGPYQISDSFIESCGYGVMFGGIDPSITDMIPSNITITRNTFTKKLAWESQDNPNIAGDQRWSCKNLLEFKAGINVTITYNTFSNNWHAAAATNGTFLWLKSVNQDSACNWCEVRNVLVSNNIATNVASGISLTDGQNSNGGTFVPMSNVTITNNYIEIDPDQFTVYTESNSGRELMILGNLDGVTISHNTFVMLSGAFSRQIEMDPAGTTRTGFVFIDNLWFDVDQGVRGPNQAEGTATLTTYAPDYTFDHNLRISANGSGTYPAGNYVESSLANASWNSTTKLFNAGSAYLTLASEGTAIGWDGTGGRP